VRETQQGRLIICKVKKAKKPPGQIKPFSVGVWKC